MSYRMVSLGLVIGLLMASRADSYLEGVDLTRPCASVAWSRSMPVDCRTSSFAAASEEDVCPFDSRRFWCLMGLPMNFRSNARPKLWLLFR